MDQSSSSIGRRALLAAAGGLAAQVVPDRRARAANAAPVRIGVLNDQSGPYAEIQGMGTVIATRMAVEEFGGSVLGRPIEILVGDHLLKPDVGSLIVRRWIDEQDVRVVVEVANAAVALAVQEIVRQKNRIAIYSSLGTTEINQKACSRNGLGWLYDPHVLSAGTAQVLVKQGYDTWFFVEADYSFGRSMEEEATKAILASGGRVLGSIRFPQNTPDFSAYLLQAAASGSKVVSIISGGADTVNALKQASEFGLRSGGRVFTVPLVFLTDVKAMGLETAQGLQFVTAFYWDRTPETRAWSRRFLARHGAMPTMSQASMYSGVLHYLKAVAAAGTVDTDPVLAAMRSLPVNDMYAQNGWIRADSRLMHDFYLVKIKSPAESKEMWDYYDILQTIPAERAYSSLAESVCPLVRAK